MSGVFRVRTGLLSECVLVAQLRVEEVGKEQYCFSVGDAAVNVNYSEYPLIGGGTYPVKYTEYMLPSE
jgi:hypothetical protein